MLKKLFYIFLILLMVAAAGCQLPWFKPPSKETIMERVRPSRWPVLADDMDKASLSIAMAQSRKYLKKIPPQREFRFGSQKYTAAHLLDSLNTFEKKFRAHGPGPELNRALKKSFTLYKSVGDDKRGHVLVTGYYEPLLYGSLTKNDEYRWPLYAKPDDLIEVALGAFSSSLAGKKIKGRIKGKALVPYHTRGDIDQRGALKGRNLEIAWVNDPVAAFFLHIQGSGRIQLNDGSIVRVGYAGSNGRPYRSLGRYMIDQGVIEPEQLSMTAVKKWLAENESQAQKLMAYNQSYVFFRPLEEGPLGNIAVPLTPGRSIALDHRIFPKGALAWIQTRRPIKGGGGSVKWHKFSRMVLVQDTGGAIRGPGRMDLFFGHGPEAEFGAGYMKESGRLFFLVKKK